MKKFIKCIKYGYSFSVSLIKLLTIKIFCRVNINFKLKNIICKNVSLRTKNKGKIVFGDMITLRPNVEISSTDGKIILEKNIFVNRNTMIVAHESVTVGEGTTIGPNVVIYDHDHVFGKRKLESNNSFSTAPVVIGKNVWIGAGAIILKGVEIGDNAIVGAGTIVTKNINDNSIIIQPRSEICKIIE